MLELSLQARWISLEETAAAVRFEGGSGTEEAAKSGLAAMKKATHNKKRRGFIITIKVSINHTSRLPAPDGVE